MGELASPSQLRQSFARWALVTVPAVVFLGFLSGRLSNSGFSNPWFDALIKPTAQPPGWVFGAAWSVLYVLLGLALALVIDARGARYRWTALASFAVAFVLNLGWSPLFFAAHQVTAALVLIIAMLVAAIATTFAFGRVRPAAAWLLVPYLAWLCFAAMLNYQIMRLNPDAETLAAPNPVTQIQL